MISGGNKVGLVAAIAYTVGDIVGSGIFVSPSVILSHSGSVGLSLIVWAVSALISSFGALCYIELGTTIRKSGNDFAYLSHAGWNAFAVAFLWVSCILTYPSILAIQTLCFGEYILNGFHKFLEVDPEWESILKRLIGFSVLLPLLFINLFSLKKAASRFQIIATTAKLAVICIIVITGFIYLIGKGNSANFQSQAAFADTTSDPGSIVLALYAGLFAYNGWDILNFGTEEIDNPRRTLPIAAFVGILLSALIFLSMNIAYFSVLTVDEFKTSETVAVTFAEKSLGSFHYAVPFLIGVLLLGNLNSTIFGSSRYLFAGGVARVMPSLVGCVHEESGSPRIAVLLEVFICVGVSFIGDLDSLISYMTFAMWMQRALTQAAFITMRIRGDMPSRADAFRVPLIVPIIFLALCIMLLVVPVWQHFKIGVFGFGLMCVGLVIYFLFTYPKRLPIVFHQMNVSTTRFAQIIVNVIPQWEVNNKDIQSTFSKEKTKM